MPTCPICAATVAANEATASAHLRWHRRNHDHAPDCTMVRLRNPAVNPPLRPDSTPSECDCEIRLGPATAPINPTPTP